MDFTHSWFLVNMYLCLIFVWLVVCWIVGYIVHMSEPRFSRTRLSDQHFILFWFTFADFLFLSRQFTDGYIYIYIYIYMEKAMAPQSSILAWKIPWMEEPGGLQSMGLLRVGQDWVTSLSFFIFMHWRRKWQPTPVFLPGESQGRGILVGCRLWGRTESNTTKAT